MVVRTVALQQEGLEFESIMWLGPLGVEFVYYSRVCVGCLWVLRLPHTVQKHAGWVNWGLYIALRCK